MNIFALIYSAYRRLVFKLLSNKKIIGRPKFISPALILGRGIIEIDDSATIGYFPSPNFFSSYMHIEARSRQAKIILGKNVFINNSCVIIAEQTSITIEDNCLLGMNVTLMDSDFHDLHPDKRISGIPKAAPIVIRSNVFIGSNVIILKGVTIGRNSVVAAGSVVAKSFGDNVIIGGNPAKIIGSL